MALTAEAKTRKAALLKKLSVHQLITSYNGLTATSQENESRFLTECTVRGWIMDELELREPQKFNNWMENTDPAIDDDLHLFFN